MELIKNYRQKTPVIRAIRFTNDPNTISNIAGFVQAAKPLVIEHGYLKVPTRNGVAVLNEGDYLVEGIDGDFGAWGPILFDLNFEPA